MDHTYSHITHIYTHTTHTVFKILETKGSITGCCCPNLDHSHLKLPEQRGQTQVGDFPSHLFPMWHRSSWESGYSTYMRVVLYWSEGDKTDHFRATGSPSQTLEVSVASGNWDWGWQVVTARPWLNQRAQLRIEGWLSSRTSTSRWTFTQKTREYWGYHKQNPDSSLPLWNHPIVLVKRTLRESKNYYLKESEHYYVKCLFNNRSD